jgi:intracellular multiplication protein IcmE
MFCHTLRFRSKRRCGKLNKALATAFVAASEAAKRHGAFPTYPQLWVGARLIGGFQANSNNTHLIVQFNQAILPDGTQVPISAYAVDARQTSLAVRTDLDRRIFERYAPRVAAAFVTGLGSSLSDPGTALIDLGGVTGVTRPEASFEQGVYSGIAQVGNDLALEFVQSAPTGPLISLRARQAIGVLFTSNVEQP